MRNLSDIRHKISRFNHKLSGFKYLKLLYFAAFAVGLTVSVYLQDTVTNTRNEAAVIPNWRCDRQAYYGRCEDLGNPYGDSKQVTEGYLTMPVCIDNGTLVHVYTNCTCASNCPTPTLAPTNTPAPPTPTRRPPTATPPNSPTPLPTAVPSPTPVGNSCGGSIPSNAISWGNGEEKNVPPNTSWKYSYVPHSLIKCEFRCNDGYSWNETRCSTGGLGGGPTATKRPTASPTIRPTNTSAIRPTNTPRPTATPTPVLGNKGCGISCGSTSECQSGFTCMDVNSGGNVCWNAGICGGPALKSRVEGVVRGCNNEPLQNVPVWAWGNTDYTDQNGKFQLNKGVSRNSEGDITVNETTIKAGNDATFNTTTGLGYFDNGTGRQYDALQLRSGNSCGLVNCLFSNRVGDGLNIGDSHKLMAGGPSRTAYRLGRRSTNPNQGLTDALFEYNFVFTDYHARSFNFKKIDCPTVPPPTLTPPPILSCNASCTLDSQCRNTSDKWFCMMQWNYWWTNFTSQFLGNNGLPAGAKITGMNNRISADGQKYEQHVIANGTVYYRSRPAAQSNWTGINLNTMLNNVNINTWVDDVGCNALGLTGTACSTFKSQYKIVDFNSYHYIKNGNKYTQQHLIRSNGTSGYIFAVNNEGGWKPESDWTNVTGSGFTYPVGSNLSPATVRFNLNSNGSLNGLTSFSAYINSDNQLTIAAVVANRVYLRSPGLFNEWRNVGDSFYNCTNNPVTTSNCGSDSNNNPIIMFKTIAIGNNREYSYLVRKNGDAVFQRTSDAKKNADNSIDQKCRLRWNPYHPSCASPQ